MEPFNLTRPARINSVACEREQYPSFDSVRAKPIFRADCSRFIELMLSDVL
jgi:hypothetical protein